jgi:hypothetical protein
MPPSLFHIQRTCVQNELHKDFVKEIVKRFLHTIRLKLTFHLYTYLHYMQQLKPEYFFP